MTESKYIRINQFKFECFHFRGGDKYLIGFNGFGENASQLELIIKVHPQYSLVAINLPFHGNTSIVSENAQKLSKTQLQELILQVVNLYNINSFSLFGYSLGAKIALCIAELIPSRINQLILYAPDGLRRGEWYNIVVSNPLLRKLFKNIIINPNWFFTSIKLLKSTGLLPTSIYKFIRLHLETEEKRRLVYDVWYCLQYLVPNINQVKNNITEANMDVQLFFGSKDKIIRPTSAKKFVSNIESDCKLKILESGHRMITAENLKFMQ